MDLAVDMSADIQYSWGKVLSYVPFEIIGKRVIVQNMRLFTAKNIQLLLSVGRHELTRGPLILSWAILKKLKGL